MTMLAFAAVLTPMRESVGAGLFAISVVGNISYFSFGLSAPVSGFLADKIGSRRVLVICCLGMAAASLGVALAPNIYVLGGALGVLGLAAALYHPAGLSLIARRVAGVEKAMAYHGILGTLGLALGPLVAGAIAAAAGW
ncbi:MAG: MFS transporter, partial [Candidatus Coatesbacteria bacterium]